jgi:hypothetical protein
MSDPGPGPALSVALSVFNGERYLAAAIDSVLAQTFTDFELLVLDDGSTDGTAAIICAAAARDGRVRPILRENRGLIASLNELIAAARAPVVARMDADDICHPERFARQHAFLAARQEIGLVGCWNAHIDAKGRETHVSGADHPQDHAGIIAAMERGETPFSHPAVMFRRDLVLAAGGYRPAFRHCEDLDLWLRLADRTRLANLPERLIHYRRHYGQVSANHTLAQQWGGAVARLAWAERRAGRADPIAGMATLPPPAGIDQAFGRAGAGAEACAMAVPGLLWSSTCASAEGLAIIAAHRAAGGTGTGLWRAAFRLARYGHWSAALRLARTIALT